MIGCAKKPRRNRKAGPRTGTSHGLGRCAWLLRVVSIARATAMGLQFARVFASLASKLIGNEGCNHRCRSCRALKRRTDFQEWPPRVPLVRYSWRSRCTHSCLGGYLRGRPCGQLSDLSGPRCRPVCGRQRRCDDCRARVRSPHLDGRLHAHVQPGQFIIFNTATGLSSLVFAKLLAERGVRPTIIDLATSVCMSRVFRACACPRCPLKAGVDVAAIPAHRGDAGRAVVRNCSATCSCCVSRH